MLKLVVPGEGGWDEVREEFVEIGNPTTLLLEHSLLAISKWESKWKKCFLSNGVVKPPPRTMEETLYYIQCMTINSNVDPNVYKRLTAKNLKEIEGYIADPMTATHFADRGGPPKRRSNEAMTSELIYYWMVALQIPFECQKWNINRLLTLIEVCNRKQEKPKKMPANKVMAQHRALNQARRARNGGRG